MCIRDRLKALRDTPINRLSIGIQSFSEEDLRFMNRAHTAKESRACLEKSLAMGFDNFTIDLIYGTPTTDDATWTKNLEIVKEYNIPHLSCYSLTVEEGTALDAFIKKGKVKPLKDEQSIRHFEILQKFIENSDYEQYEISNFALPNCYAQHNSNYWKGVSYLGIGPSAHSFNGESRQWNIAHNAQYLKAIQSGKINSTIEKLTPIQRYNEYVLTGIRTKWGCEMPKLIGLGDSFAAYFKKTVQTFLNDGTVLKENERYYLSKEGKLLADHIAMELFFE